MSGLSISLEDCVEDLRQRKKNEVSHVKPSPLNVPLQRLAKRATEKGKVRTLNFETLRPEAREHNKSDSGRKPPR
jgi:hypothetical protein